MFISVCVIGLWTQLCWVPPGPGRRQLRPGEREKEHAGRCAKQDRARCGIRTRRHPAQQWSRRSRSRRQSSASGRLPAQHERVLKKSR